LELNDLRQAARKSILSHFELQNCLRAQIDLVAEAANGSSLTGD